MKKVILYSFALLFILAAFTMPVFAQENEGSAVLGTISSKALAMAIAAAGCGYAQSKALNAGCEGVSRNPGSSDTVRFFIILGLAFIEFLALLVFLYISFIG